ncbi:hypothetical protein AGR7A_Lc120644 [Agrobacterium deltaense NCPPB 1641]|uniref:Uncharacterized protein n=1 Tax=Agrobacterium deltaense NCPPB 1641 TaxID=1183425 RepID=A0A1S7TYP2_9HYPH|nr:hypothetical protein AGR7A_Lc120644 [Agrobacterium deltaense NCPPB 1641]
MSSREHLHAVYGLRVIKTFIFIRHDILLVILLVGYFQTAT